MQLRCYRCGWSFAIKKEEIAFALEALEESEGNHYDVRCTRCRHMNRVSIEQLRKFAPKLETAEPASQSADGDSMPESEASAAEASASVDEPGEAES